MHFDGYGYEFEARYYGGPGDGLETSVVSINTDAPPDVSCLELHNLLETKSPLGRHFLSARPPNGVRVGVYMLENKPDDYKSGDFPLIYRFIEMMDYGEFCKKYKEN